MAHQQIILKYNSIYPQQEHNTTAILSTAVAYKENTARKALSLLHTNYYEYYLLYIIIIIVIILYYN